MTISEIISDLSIIDRVSCENMEEICLAGAVSLSEHDVPPECSPHIKINLRYILT